MLQPTPRPGPILNPRDLWTLLGLAMMLAGAGTLGSVAAQLVSGP